MTRSTRRVVVQPASAEALARGADQIVAAVRPTLGPLPRLTAVERSNRDQSPELLDDGGTIARRIIGLADRDADMGAMLLRNAMWHLREDVGDGTVTAAVIFDHVFKRGRRYVAAGANPMLLRTGLERAARIAAQSLGSMAAPIDRNISLARLAGQLCHDDALASTLGEALNLIGEHGRLDLRKGHGRHPRREYVEGMYWDNGWLSRQTITDNAGREIRLEDAATLVSDLVIDDVPALSELMDALIQAGYRSFFIVADQISDEALGVLRLYHDRAGLACLPVKTQTSVPARVWELEDMAKLTGARPFLRAAGDTLAGGGVHDLGHARRAWATRDHHGIVGGRGDAKTLRRHIEALKAGLPRERDRHLHKLSQDRIGRLLGGTAIVWVAGDSDSEIAYRHDLAERAVKTLRGALGNGVVPGAGVALLACRADLARVCEEPSTELTAEERCAFQIVREALAVPAGVILENAGYEPPLVLAQIEEAGPPFGFDVMSGRVVDVVAAGIVDVAAVQQAAVRSAISAAAMALTTEVLVHSAKPRHSLQT